MQRRPHTARVRRGATRHGFGTWLGMVALWLQVVVPLGQAVPLPATADGLARSLVICTAFGPRTMTPDRQEAPGRTASPSGAAHACPVCTALGCQGLAAPAMAVPLPAGPALRIATGPVSDTVSDRRPLVRHARGPPAAAA